MYPCAPLLGTNEIHCDLRSVILRIQSALLELSKAPAV